MQTNNTNNLGAIDFKKMYDAGLTDLYFGGEVDANGNYFRSKDVLEEDYSDPLMNGRCKIASVKTDANCHYIHFINGCGVVLSDDEFQAGYVCALFNTQRASLPDAMPFLIMIKCIIKKYDNIAQP